MTARRWTKKIKEACVAAGTYQTYFDDVISTLATILEQRDNAYDLFIKSGGQTIVKYTNKGGATNPTRHPALKLMTELNQTALAYWRDLGLTPAGLRRINEEAMKPKKQTALAKALSDLEKEL